MKISSSAVEAELERVLESRCFRSRKAAQKFLGYIVHKTIEGHGKDINQHSIATEGLGKEADFDPSSNPLIRVQAGRLRKQLEEYYAGEGRENMIRIMLPIGSYQPAFMNRDEHQKFNVYAGRPRSPGTSHGPALVCVPRMFTQDKTAGWATVTRLTRDYVISLTQFNCCQILFADENKSARQVWPDTAWNDYEADFALLFDLHDDDDGYHLKCSLAHSQTRRVIWADTYDLDKIYPSDERLQQIFRYLAHNTINLERGVAHDSWARHLLDTQASLQPQYQVMLALRQAIWDMTPKTLRDAQKVCQQRMESFPRDVQNLVAYAELFCISFLVTPGKFDSSPDKRTDLAAKLMRLAPGNAYTHLFQAFIDLTENQVESSNAHLAKALEINPLDTHLKAITGLMYAINNDWEKGIGLVQASTDNLTSYPDWYRLPVALNFYRLGDYQRALKEAEHIRTPTFWAPLLRTVLYFKQGMQQRADQELAQLEALYPGITSSQPDYLESLPPNARKVIGQLWAELPSTIMSMAS